MLNRNNKNNIIILIFSTLLGIFISGLGNSKIAYAPFSIKNIQDTQLEVMKVEKEIEDIDKLIEEKEAQYERLRVVTNKEVKDMLLDELESMKLFAGFSSVKGPGLSIIMKDSNMKEGLDSDLEVIHDADVLRILNDLKTAGAEAISVNGQRVLSFSEIKCGGPIIRVNGKSMGAPFVIKAIGNPKLLKASVSAPNTYAYGLMHIDRISIDTEVNDEIIIEGYSGNFNYKNSKVLEEGK